MSATPITGRNNGADPASAVEALSTPKNGTTDVLPPEVAADLLAQPLSTRLPEAQTIDPDEPGDLARMFADLYSEFLEPPWEFFYFSFLTYFGTVLARMVTLASALDVQPRLYTVLLGKSGDTRKSTALRQTDAFFKRLGLANVPWTTLNGVGSAEGLGQAITESETTPVLLHLDEFKSFVDKAKIDGSILLQMVGTLFERGSWGNRTKKEKIEIEDARLSVLAASTVDTYETMFSQAFMAIGFLNRLWLVTGRSTKSFAIPGKLPEDRVNELERRVKARLHRLYEEYAANGEQAVEYTITPDAWAIFNDWYRRRTGTIFETRLDTYGHRLALLLAVTQGKSEIDAEIMRAVVGLLEAQLGTRRTHDPIDAENKLAGLEEKIRRVLADGPLTAAELKRRCNYTRYGLWAWKMAFGNMVEHEVVYDSGSKTYRLKIASLAASAPQIAGGA
jgi:hypothetical protein